MLLKLLPKKILIREDLSISQNTATSPSFTTKKFEASIIVITLHIKFRIRRWDNHFFFLL